MSNKIIDLQGHRGARAHRPENTIPAFLFCVESRMSTIELDTALTKDDDLVVCHDTKLNPELVADKYGDPAPPLVIREMTVAELKNMILENLKIKKFPRQKTEPGTEIITLHEFFEFISDGEKSGSIHRDIKFNIEIKFPRKFDEGYLKTASQKMVDEIIGAGMESRSTVQCFNMDALKEVKKINPKQVTSALFLPTHCQGLMMLAGLKANREKIIEKAVDAGAEIISPQFLYINPEFVMKCHELNLLVLPWVVNRKNRMIKMMEYGVDGIISDYPDRLYRVCCEYIEGERR